jgi:hypothetical protein
LLELDANSFESSQASPLTDFPLLQVILFSQSLFIFYLTFHLPEKNDFTFIGFQSFFETLISFE